MKKILSFLALALAVLPAAAQQKTTATYEAAAFRELNKEWSERYEAQLKLDAEAKAYGNYEVHVCQKLSPGAQGRCIWDTITHWYLPGYEPASNKQVKEYQKLKLKDKVPVGTRIPVRMYFVDSEKGPMKGCPERMNGLLFMDSFVYDIPDSVYNSGVKEPNRKKETQAIHEVGFYRIQDGTLKEVLPLGKLSTSGLNDGATSNLIYATWWANNKRTSLNPKGSYPYATDYWVDLVEPLPGTEYLKISRSHVKSDHYIYDEKSEFYQYWEIRLLDWNGNEVLSGASSITTDGKYIWAKKDGKTKAFDLQMNPIQLPYDNYESMVLKDYGPVTLVEKGDLWGMLDGTTGELLIPCVFAERGKENAWKQLEAAIGYSFRPFAYSICKKRISAQYNTKDEFEKESQFQERMADPALQEAYVEKKTGGIFDAYIKSANFTLMLRPYDAETETFPLVLGGTTLRQIPGTDRPVDIQVPIVWRTYTLPVPIADAPAFKAAYDKMLPDALAGVKWHIVADLPDLDEITFTLPESGKQFRYKK